MDKTFYELAEILVCDPVVPNRATTRSALYSLGCRNIEVVTNLRDFLNALENRPPDLALCEAQVGEAELCHAIRQLRQGERRYNPFVIIIVTAWTRTAALTEEIINSGADGLLLRPFSAATLDRRIRTHVLHQKPFVITNSYIGPERRDTEKRPSTMFSFTPPNSLKMKIEGGPHIDETIRRYNAELRAASTKLAAEKRRLAATTLQD